MDYLNGAFNAALSYFHNDQPDPKTQSNQVETCADVLSDVSIEQLFNAIEQRDLKSFKVLLDNFDGHLSDRNAEGQTLLHATANSDEYDFLKALINSPHKPKLDFEAHDKNGLNALTSVVKRGRCPAMVPLLANAGANGDAVEGNI